MGLQSVGMGLMSTTVSLFNSDMALYWNSLDGIIICYWTFEMCR